MHLWGLKEGEDEGRGDSTCMKNYISFTYVLEFRMLFLESVLSRGLVLWKQSHSKEQTGWFTIAFPVGVSGRNWNLARVPAHNGLLL